MVLKSVSIKQKHVPPLPQLLLNSRCRNLGVRQRPLKARPRRGPRQRGAVAERDVGRRRRRAGHHDVVGGCVVSELSPRCGSAVSCVAGSVPGVGVCVERMWRRGRWGLHELSGGWRPFRPTCTLTAQHTMRRLVPGEWRAQDAAKNASHGAMQVACAREGSGVLGSVGAVN